MLNPIVLVQFFAQCEAGDRNRNCNRNPCTFTYLNPCSATI